MRRRRKLSGQTRCEVYTHPEDHPKVKAKAAALNKARAKLTKAKD